MVLIPSSYEICSGYVLIGLPLIIFTSLMIERLNINKTKDEFFNNDIIITSVFIYFGRNIVRLNKEINFYNYPIVDNYIYVAENESITILNKGDFKIYSVKGGKMCWQQNTLFI